MIYRYLNPDLSYVNIDDYRWIYKFKLNSIMYGGSNMLGIHVLVLLFFLLYLDLTKFKVSISILNKILLII